MQHKRRRQGAIRPLSKKLSPHILNTPTRVKMPPLSHMQAGKRIQKKWNICKMRYHRKLKGFFVLFTTADKSRIVPLDTCPIIQAVHFGLTLDFHAAGDCLPFFQGAFGAFCEAL